MNDRVAAFAARYPCAWHVTETEGADCTMLYPAVTLRAMGGRAADGANREDFEPIRLPDGQTAVLRKQLMPDAALTPTLRGRYAGRPDLWRAHIDQHVFFWLSEDRRDRFLRACFRLRSLGFSGRGATPVAIEVDTATLLTTQSEAAYFSSFNTGSTVRGGARVTRDEHTFRPIASWRREPAVELAIRGAVALDAVGRQQHNFD